MKPCLLKRKWRTLEGDGIHREKDDIDRAIKEQNALILGLEKRLKHAFVFLISFIKILIF